MNPVQVPGGDGAVARALAARLRAQALGEVGVEAERAVVVDLGPPEGRRERWGHALEAGSHVLSASLDPRDAQWARDQWGEAAVVRGVSFLPTAGASAVIGEALVMLAAQAMGVDEVEEVHVSHLIAERGGLLGVAGPGLRRELAHLVGAPTLVRIGGTLVEEATAERRRLAWFARPVGPHHAASVPSPEVVTAAHLLPRGVTVTGHLAMATWRAELLQASGGLAQFGPGKRWIVRRRLQGRGTEAPGGARWAIVAEARSAGDQVVRAWANGRGLAMTTAATLHVLSDRLSRGNPIPGTPAATDLVPPDDLLDRLAQDVGLRWSVVRPGGGDHA